jgi:hypothetical protein
MQQESCSFKGGVTAGSREVVAIINLLQKAVVAASQNEVRVLDVVLQANKGCSWMSRTDVAHHYYHGLRAVSDRVKHLMRVQVQDLGSSDSTRPRHRKRATYRRAVAETARRCRRWQPFCLPPGATRCCAAQSHKPSM